MRPDSDCRLGLQRRAPLSGPVLWIVLLGAGFVGPATAQTFDPNIWLDPFFHPEGPVPAQPPPPPQPAQARASVDRRPPPQRPYPTCSAACSIPLILGVGF